MATTLVEPFAPWLRELSQVLQSAGTTVGAFIPPADLLVDDEGVTVYMDVPGMKVEDLVPRPEAHRARRIEIKAASNGSSQPVIEGAEA